MRCDSEEKLVKIIDYFRSNANQAAMDASRFKELWGKQSLSHPWLRIFEKQDKLTVENLIKLAIDVYNDSKQLILSVWSWPSWSFTTAHAEQQTSCLQENGMYAPFIPFAPT